MNKAILISCIISLFYSCSGVRQASKLKQYIPINPITINLTESVADSLKITYTGCGGFLIQQHSSALLIDPYFSNINPLPLILFKNLKTDTAVINEFFMEHFDNSKDSNGIIKAILVAHSHYDHLADVPSIYLQNCNRDSTEIIGSPTTKHILKSSEIKKDVTIIKVFEELNSEANLSKGYQWIYTRNNKIRILPIASEHAPHFCGIKFLSSEKLKKDVSEFPTKVTKFPEGENYNFIIDLLDDDHKVKLRIFSHAGAACDSDIGLPHDSVLVERPIDVLLLCVANYDQVDNYPEEILKRLKPRLIIGNHWENFFRPYKANINKPATVPNTNVKKFITRVVKELKLLKLNDSTKLLLPKPTTTIIMKY